MVKKWGGQLGQYASPDPANYAEGATQSLVAGFGELIGQEPSLGVQRWREQNPLGGFITSVAPGVGYGGAALKLGRLGKFGKALETIGETKGWHPILKYAAREAARFAPFEAGRIGLTAATGGDLEEVLLDSAIGMGLTAGIGGAVGALESAGRAINNKWGRFGESLNAPTQLRARALADQITQGKVPAEGLADAQRQLDEWRRTVRVEYPEKFYTRPLPRKEAARQLERMFFQTQTKTGPHMRLQLARTQRGFQTGQAAKLAEEKLGLPPGWEDYAQHPRVNIITSPEAEATARRVLRSNMHAVGEDAWIAKERGGLYTVVKKGKDGHWIALKTDEPGKFISDGGLKARVEQQSAWLRAPTKAEANAASNSPALKFGKDYKDTIPFAMMAEDVAGKSPKAALDYMTKGLAKYYGIGDTGAAFEKLGEFVSRTVAPGMHQFRNMPIARYTMGGIRAIFNEGNARAAEFLIGSKQLDAEGLLKQTLKGVKPTGGILKDINELGPEDLQALTRVFDLGTRKGAELTEKASALLDKLDAKDKEVLAELSLLRKATGKPMPATRLEHYMITRGYRGVHRAPVYEGNTLIGLGSGTWRKEAEDEAKRIVEWGKANGRDWNYKGEVYTVGGAEDDLRAINNLVKDVETLGAFGQARGAARAHLPGHFNERSGIEAGYTGGAAKGGFTKDELAQTIAGHLQQNMKYISEEASLQTFAQELARIDGEHQGVSRQIRERINDLVGVKNTADAWQNKMADLVLAPILGKNSASKIVRGLNEYTYHMQLGSFANAIGYPLVNLMTALQTVMPEIAFVMHGSAARKAMYYDNWLVPKGMIGALSPFKLLGQGFRELRQPGEEFIQFANRALREGTLEPRLVEEFIGPTARIPVTFREVMKNRGDGIVSLVKQVSTMGPEAAERLSRTHAFATAYRLGRDVMGLQDEKLYRFAKQFTDRTMFGYSVADRPRIFTGPFGSAFGLFKNWQMHYIYNWLDYLGEATAKNEWRPLLWGTIGSGALGGIPATGLTYLAADSASRWLANESLMELWFDTFGKGAGSDALWNGIPGFLPTLAGLPGISFTSQADTPGADPSRNVAQLMGFVYWDRLKALGNAWTAATQQADATGANPLRSEQVVGLLARALAPKMIYRAQQTVSEGTINSSSTIYPNLTGLTPMETMLYRMGLNPNRIEYAFRAGEELWNDQEKLKEQIQSSGAALAEAISAGDYEAQQRVMQQVMVKQLDMSRVMRSAHARLAKTQVDMFARNFSPEKVQRWVDIGVLGE